MLEDKKVEKIWATADCLIEEEQVERAIAKVAKAIEENMSTKNPVIVCVMTGGLIFTAKLLMQLRFPLEVDYVHVSRYEGGVVGGTLKWMAEPSIDLRDRHVIIVDDILDEGETLREITRICQKQNAREVRSAVLVNKLHDRKVQGCESADYTALEIEDRYLFGYGMDYKGYLRNAPGIFAVKGL